MAVDGRYARRPGLGIHTYLRQVVRLLNEAGASVTLLTNFPPGWLETDYPSASWKHFGSSRSLFWEQVSLPRLLRNSEFDLYWAPGNTGVPGSPVGAVKTVLTLHDLIPLKLARMYLSRRPRYAVPYLLGTTTSALRSDKIFSVSATSARDLHTMFRRQSVVAPTILFQDVISTGPADGDTLHELAKRIEPGTRYVVYNGGFEARKNVFVLLEGFGLARHAYPDLHLVLMGGGYEPLRPAIQSLDLERAVILTGFVSEALKAAILQHAVALIYPSLYEGFGLPVLEGFANGVPVVTSRNGSLEEVAGDAALYLSNPSDPACVAAAITRIQDPDVRASLRDAGTARWRSYDAKAVRDLVLAELRATLVT